MTKQKKLRLALLIALAVLAVLAFAKGWLTPQDVLETMLPETAGAGQSSEASLPEFDPADTESAAELQQALDGETPPEDGKYTDRDTVALYLHLYGHLPDNYITKSAAQALGWDSGKGNLWQVAEGKSIGGDRFGNREGLLPAADGRKWYECDIDYDGGYRGAKRILYSSDGLIYYTEDHYESFEQLY